MSDLSISLNHSVFKRDNDSTGIIQRTNNKKSSITYREEPRRGSSFGIEMSSNTSAKDSYISRTSVTACCCCCCLGGGGGADSIRNK